MLPDFYFIEMDTANGACSHFFSDFLVKGQRSLSEIKENVI